MGKRMTREEFLEAVFSRRYEELKGRELRTVRVRVVGKELSLAQLIGVTDRRVYENLGLHIGTHLGEDHTGQSIGLLHLTPWEATVVAADVAMKSGNVELGFLDRFLYLDFEQLRLLPDFGSAEPTVKDHVSFRVTARAYAIVFTLLRVLYAFWREKVLDVFI